MIFLTMWVGAALMNSFEIL